MLVPMKSIFKAIGAAGVILSVTAFKDIDELHKDDWVVK
jgi:hypothetical protein